MLDLTDPPVIVEIRRRVRPDARAAFEADLKGLIQDSLAHAGNESATVYKPEDGAGEPEYRVVIKFARDSHWRTWQRSPLLAAWYERIRAHLVADPVVSEMTGLEAWFSLPGEKTVRPPPRHKMALVTWLGVFIGVTVVSTALAPVVAEWNPHLRTLVVSGLVVLLLTYLVMPNLTRLFRPWLYR
jgi:antibiotic biosynthesis monooxygenase (ABM) superfamily enzyme